MILCLGCEWRLRSSDNGEENGFATIERYDRIESLYLTTGDFAALGQMNTSYPRQTRILIEDLLKLGNVDDPQINRHFFHFFQDTTLQMIIAEVNRQYEKIDDIEKEMRSAFEQLQKMIPSLVVPEIYTQIGALDQSIVVGEGVLGISLDKYLGADNSIYMKYGYTERQREMMQRKFIVPDCLSFYLLSLYPLPANRDTIRMVHFNHMGTIQWVVNKALKRKVFDNEYVAAVEKQMKTQSQKSVDELLKHI